MAAHTRVAARCVPRHPHRRDRGHPRGQRGRRLRLRRRCAAPAGRSGRADSCGARPGRRQPREVGRTARRRATVVDGGRGLTVAFDPFEAGFVESPYGQYARLRAADPVHWSDLLGGWVLTRYDDVARILREPTISVELDHARDTPVVSIERARMEERGGKADTLVLRDDPDHARLRRLMQQPFGVRAIESLRAMVGERVDGEIDALVPLGEMDVIGDFAYPLPVAVFCEMLGIPDEDSPNFREWTAAVARNLDPLITPDEREHNFALMDDMEIYLEAQIEEKRRHPANDIM